MGGHQAQPGAGTSGNAPTGPQLLAHMAPSLLSSSGTAASYPHCRLRMGLISALKGDAVAKSFSRLVSHHHAQLCLGRALPLGIIRGHLQENGHRRQPPSSQPHLLPVYRPGKPPGMDRGAASTYTAAVSPPQMRTL